MTAIAQRARPLELLFDVIYVFAFTQVTHLMGSSENFVAVLQGLAAFGILWWSWALFTWLGNQHGVDRRSVRAGLIGGIVITFLTSLSIPEAFDDLPGGMEAPYVFAGGFVAISLLFTAASLAAARTNRSLVRQVLRTMGITLPPVATLLVVGVVLGGSWQIVCWLSAVAIQGGVALATSVRGQWRLPSPEHYSERHQLVVILALGESIISTGAGVAGHPLGLQLVLTAAGCVALTLSLWWSYFSGLASVVSQVLASRDGLSRAMLGTGGTYLHLIVVASVLLVALGTETIVESAEESRPANTIGVAALVIGVSIFLASTGAYWYALTGTITRVRFAAAFVAALATPFVHLVYAATVPVMAALLCLIVFLAERPRRHNVSGQVELAG